MVSQNGLASFPDRQAGNPAGLALCLIDEGQAPALDVQHAAMLLQPLAPAAIGRGNETWE